MSVLHSRSHFDNLVVVKTEIITKTLVLFKFQIWKGASVGLENCLNVRNAQGKLVYAHEDMGESNIIRTLNYI